MKAFLKGLIFTYMTTSLYDPQGPSTWHKLFPIAKGERQSPIDIKPKEAKYDMTLDPLHIKYDASSSQTIYNNGTTFIVEFDDSKGKSVLTGGPFHVTYRLKMMHMHWGSSDDRGSEHSVDGVKYSAELHLLHWNTIYRSYEDALKYRDGLCVIAVLVKVAEFNPNIQRVIEALTYIPHKGMGTSLKDYDASILLPRSLNFWTYDGSFTTPPLVESVIWIILRDSISISAEQIAKMRGLYVNTEPEKPHVHMVNNFRPVQPLKSRKIRASFE